MSNTSTMTDQEKASWLAATKVNKTQHARKSRGRESFKLILNFTEQEMLYIRQYVQYALAVTNSMSKGMSKLLTLVIVAEPQPGGARPGGFP
eukprot:6214263-Pleurochrysis_carterae.AAC.1